MYAKTIISGHLGSDPIARTTQNGTEVTNLSVATSRSYTDSNGQLRTDTTWYRASVWGKQAANCVKHLKKGERVLIEGEMLPARIYNNRNGQPQADLEMRANLVKFMNGGNGSWQESQPGQSQ